jgi:L-fucose isomerase-like protein
MCQLASEEPATLLDINNSVPADILPPDTDLEGAELHDLFMGFHCGNTCSASMKHCSLKYQLIMKRLLEDDGEPDITRGTLEGQLRPGPTTLFRLQSTPDCVLKSYIADGRILDVDPCSFGSIGVIAIPDFARFYRHVLIGKRFPHHGAFAFANVGRILFEAVKLLGVDDIGTPLPATVLYPEENPFTSPNG